MYWRLPARRCVVAHKDDDEKDGVEDGNELCCCTKILLSQDNEMESMRATEGCCFGAGSLWCWMCSQNVHFLTRQVHSIANTKHLVFEHHAEGDVLNLMSKSH